MFSQFFFKKKLDRLVKSASRGVYIFSLRKILFLSDVFFEKFWTSDRKQYQRVAKKQSTCPKEHFEGNCSLNFFFVFCSLPKFEFWSKICGRKVCQNWLLRVWKKILIHLFEFGKRYNLKQVRTKSKSFSGFVRKVRQPCQKFILSLQRKTLRNSSLCEKKDYIFLMLNGRILVC